MTSRFAATQPRKAAPCPIAAAAPPRSRRSDSRASGIWRRTAVRLQCAAIGAAFVVPGLAGPSPVIVREESIVLPTYVAGDPEPNPMFFFGRTSQGAEGRVYPYPLFDTLTDRKEDRSYHLVTLENEYVRIGVLPEVGGRIFEGVDKSNGYDFFYRQHVIKPALIGLIGAWISGGVEWNIPHHHRASTFLPVQHRIEEHPDGSKTVWVGELELRHRMRWAVGYTLRPGKSYLEAKLRILNRTPVVNTMLCFANVAVHVDENYQVIFPPGTQYVTHHHKREFTTWPIATTRYGGYDFGTGIDVSWYSNHIAANSMFAWNYRDDFLAGYDHGRQAGLLSVANHHIVPGKKLWTWGSGPRGRMWDRILTDEDGPYIELMVGAYSDNQPDYSWLQPFETKSFSMYWYPFQALAGVKSATLEAAVNLEVTNGMARVAFCTTAPHRDAQAVLTAGDTILMRAPVEIDPAHPFVREVEVPAGIQATQLRASLRSGAEELVAYQPVAPTEDPMPPAVTSYPDPKEFGTVEELYLAGLRVEQFHSPSLDPEPLWEEALRRDAGEARVHTAWGIRLLKQARYEEAEGHLRSALDRLTDRYTTPKDAEATYYLGICLRAQERWAEAYDTLYRATWSWAWRAPAYHALAEIDSRRIDWRAALGHLNRSLEANALNTRALALKSAVLRALERNAEALTVVRQGHDLDPLDPRWLAEEWLTSADASARTRLLAELKAHPATGLELAAEFLNAGLWADGTAVLDAWTAGQGTSPGAVTPLAYFYLAYFAHQQGLDSERYRRGCEVWDDRPLFPFQSELIPVLRLAMDQHPESPYAAYHLGNLLYDWQPDQALALWKQAIDRGARFPILLRNLAVAYSHQEDPQGLTRAVLLLEQAVQAPEPYPLHFAELDELYAAAGVAPEKRLALLEQHAEVVRRRDDALARAIGLKVLLGKETDAITLMAGRQFNVWEGGSLSVARDWTDAHLQRGHRRLAAGRPAEALDDYLAAASIPDNLPSEERGRGGRQAELLYWQAAARDALGQEQEARQLRQRIADLQDPQGDQRYYQGLTFSRLGDTEAGQRRFKELIESGQEQLKRSGRGDGSESPEDRQSQRARTADARYWIGLGQVGLGHPAAAAAEFQEALALSPDHRGARQALMAVPTE